MTTVGLKPGSRKAGSALALLTEPQLIVIFCLIIVLILCNSHLIVLLPLLCVMAAFLTSPPALLVSTKSV